MLTRIRHWWQELRSSFWFVPTVIVMVAVGLAITLIAVDASFELHFETAWPLIFGAGAAGARGLLTAVATSMITVAGVVFSITIVALALTSSQYTPRVLRNFMSDRSNQVVLGVFVGIFAYCLVVLRTIRGGDEGAFVPSLAVMGALVLAFVGISYLIYFIHHISVSIQASSIISAAARETMAAIESLFPEELGESIQSDSDECAKLDAHALPDDVVWTAVPAGSIGYIESVDDDALLLLAREHDVIVRMEHGIGEFVIEGGALASVNRKINDADEFNDSLNAAYAIGRQRTVHQDAGFGIRQLVDIALRALSPGINDSTTATMCVDYLGAILAKLAGRGFASNYRVDNDGELRVIARGQTFESLLNEAFDQIRQSAEGNVAVLSRQLSALESIARSAIGANRRLALRDQVGFITTIAKRTIALPHDCEAISARSARLLSVLEG